jgi:tetratricopeptide (TPR) repeat protein
VYVLSATHHRVPRWFTEGLAVYEETAASPDWGDRLDPEAIKAIRDKKLLPIADLDRGFVRPSYPSQVVVSYFQAGKICEFIAEKWEYNRFLGMIRRFAANETTPQVINAELHVTPEEFDRKFFAWLDQQTGKQVQGFEKWEKEMKAIDAAARGKRTDEVISKGAEIRALYPDYVEEHSVYELLADAYLSKGEKARAMESLEAYSAIGGRTPETLKKLAGLQREAGKLKEAAATLERINFIYLKDEEMHKSLGEISMQLGRKDEAIREFQAVIHCQPLDKAAAHYNLARAYVAAGRTNEAKDEVFTALEAAPGFKPAQKLLLEITQRGATD